MSITLRKSRIRGSRARLRTHMMHTTIAPRFSMAGRPLSTSRLPINPTTACRSITPPPTILMRFSPTQPTWLGTHPPGTWGTQGRRTSAPVPRPMLSSRPFILL
jgi:hypothetical protein